MAPRQRALRHRVQTEPNRLNQPPPSRLHMIPSPNHQKRVHMDQHPIHPFFVQHHESSFWDPGRPTGDLDQKSAVVKIELEKCGCAE